MQRLKALKSHQGLMRYFKTPRGFLEKNTSNDSYTNSLVFIIASATIFQSFNIVDMYFQSKMMGKYITL